MITLDHDRYERELNSIAESHHKSVQARDNVKLRTVDVGGGGGLHARIPKIYQPLDQGTDGNRDSIGLQQALMLCGATHMPPCVLLTANGCQASPFSSAVK